MQSDGAAELFNHCCSLCCFRAFKTARLLARLDSDLVPGAASDAVWFWGESAREVAMSCGESAHCVAMSRGESAHCVVMSSKESARGVAMRGDSARGVTKSMRIVALLWGESTRNAAVSWGKSNAASSRGKSARIAAKL